MPPIIAAMSERSFDLPMQIRTSDRAKLAFDHVVASIRATDLRWHGKRITKEAAFAGLCLWLEELGPEVVAAGLARHLPRLEAMMAGDPDPGPIARPDPVPENSVARASPTRDIPPDAPKKRRSV
jgi:hypothetical protein